MTDEHGETSGDGPATVRFGLWGLLSAATAVTAALTLAGFLGRAWWLFDVTCHFRVQYAACLAMAALLFAVGKRRKQALAAAAFCAVNVAVIAPLFVGAPTGRGGGTPLKLLWANVHVGNSRHADLVDLIRRESPDVVALAEISSAWVDSLRELDGEYPHRVVSPRRDAFGIAVLSRLPLVPARIDYFGPAGVPSVIATVQSGGAGLTLIAAHPPPPLGSRGARLRNDDLRGMAAACAGLDGPVVLLGDLNCTPWSPHFRDLLRDGGLLHGSRGRGLLGTFPSGNPLMRIPIDHCLVSPGVTVRDVRVGPDVGSDHLPLIAEVVVP